MARDPTLPTFERGFAAAPEWYCGGGRLKRETRTEECNYIHRDGRGKGRSELRIYRAVYGRFWCIDVDPRELGA